jgi:hypothetical protein
MHSVVDQPEVDPLRVKKDEKGVALSKFGGILACQHTRKAVRAAFS